MKGNSLGEEGLFDFSGESFNAETSLGSLYLQKAARVTREVNLRQARALHRVALERLVATERGNRRSQTNKTEEEHIEQEQRFQAVLSEETGVCIIAVQHVFPAVRLTELLQLKELVKGLYSLSSSYVKYLSRYENTVPEGLLFLDESEWARGRDGQQIHANGLIFDSHDCVYTNEEQPIVSATSMAERFVLILRATHNLFRNLNFQGDLAVTVVIDRVEGTLLLPLPVRSIADVSLRFRSQQLLSSYRFEKTLPAAVWKDEHALQEFALKFIEEMCWGLGQGLPSRAQVETCLRQVKLLIE